MMSAGGASQTCRWFPAQCSLAAAASIAAVSAADSLRTLLDMVTCGVLRVE